MATKWEYRSVRYELQGRGIAQEFKFLDVDGVRVEDAKEKENQTL